MQRTVFTKSIQFLIISLLFLAIFLPRKTSQIGMIILASLWILCSIIYFIYRHCKNKVKTTSVEKTFRNTPKEKNFKLFRLSSQIPNKEHIPSEKASPDDEMTNKLCWSIQRFALVISSNLLILMPPGNGPNRQYFMTSLLARQSAFMQKTWLLIITRMSLLTVMAESMWSP